MRTSLWALRKAVNLEWIIIHYFAVFVFVFVFVFVYLLRLYPIPWLLIPTVLIAVDSSHWLEVSPRIRPDNLKGPTIALKSLKGRDVEDCSLSDPTTSFLTELFSDLADGLLMDLKLILGTCDKSQNTFFCVFASHLYSVYLGVRIFLGDIARVVLRPRFKLRRQRSEA